MKFILKMISDMGWELHYLLILRTRTKPLKFANIETTKNDPRGRRREKVFYFRVQITEEFRIVSRVEKIRKQINLVRMVRVKAKRIDNSENSISETEIKQLCCAHMHNIYYIIG